MSMAPCSRDYRMFKNIQKHRLQILKPIKEVSETSSAEKTSKTETQTAPREHISVEESTIEDTNSIKSSQKLEQNEINIKESLQTEHVVSAGNVKMESSATVSETETSLTVSALEHNRETLSVATEQSVSRQIVQVIESESSNKSFASITESTLFESNTSSLETTMTKTIQNTTASSIEDGVASVSVYVRDGRSMEEISSINIAMESEAMFKAYLQSQIKTFISQKDTLITHETADVGVMEYVSLEGAGNVVQNANVTKTAKVTESRETVREFEINDDELEEMKKEILEDIQVPSADCGKYLLGSHEEKPNEEEIAGQVKYMDDALMFC
ncbi:hypothetical protein DPMN_187802 [Dreissena polymorpha]|uniref:Uncharacterized protein n=1 Tax=Dreissena polymorpha TaxID=45954 RepID=A0A9D4DPR0_DREPO|nr:hypothetical protein DPMN_187802 [Dreissena polymorpha]